MRQHLIYHHLQAQIMRPRHQRVEIGQRPEDRVHVDIIRHVIAHIQHRAAKERRQPDRIHPQTGQIGQPRGDAGQIADPIAIRVLK